MDWPKFGQCLLEHGAETNPDLAPLVIATKNNNWNLVKELALQAFVSSIPMVGECLADSNI